MVLGIAELATVACIAIGFAEVISAACLARRNHIAVPNIFIWPMLINTRLGDPLPINAISLKRACSGADIAEKMNCSICLEDFQQGAEQRVTVCGHKFCSLCFEKWYEQTPRCPLCNTEFRMQ